MVLRQRATADRQHAALSTGLCAATCCRSWCVGGLRKALGAQHAPAPGLIRTKRPHRQPPRVANTRPRGARQLTVQQNCRGGQGKRAARPKNTSNQELRRRPPVAHLPKASGNKLYAPCRTKAIRLHQLIKPAQPSAEAAPWPALVAVSTTNPKPSRCPQPRPRPRPPAC